MRKILIPFLVLMLGASAYSQTTIKWFANSPEKLEAYNALVKEYAKVAPNVKVEVETSQDDYPTALKLRLFSGNAPDIFTTAMGPELQAYAEYTADLSAEPLIANILPAALEEVKLQGKVVGLPDKLDSVGVIYNKKLFSAAGIATIPTTVAELEAACKKLQAKGITPFGNGFKEWWVFKHIFNHFLGADGKNVEQLVADFKAGKTNFKAHPTLTAYFDMIDLLVKYGAKDAVTTDFNGELTLIGSGKVAMITGQGDWAEDGITKIDPSIQLGIMALPVNNDPAKTKLIVGGSHAIRVSKDSKNLAEVKKFLNFWYNSDYSKKYFPEVIKYVAPTKNTAAPATMIAKDAAAYANTGNVYSWGQNWSLDSFHQKFGELIQRYLVKDLTRDQTIAEIEKSWIKLGGK